jgi:hypothetical protein
VIHAYGSAVHYWRHLEPVCAALAAVGIEVACWSPDDRPGLPGTSVRDLTNIAGPVLVASEADARRFRGRPVIYLEHGAGQTYVDAAENGVGYAGGPRLDHVILFLAPAARTVRMWEAAYPSARAVAIGCPVLDRHHGRTRGGRTVYVTAHWRCSVVPETWPALPTYAPELPALKAWLKERGYELVGHSHPRDQRRFRELFVKHGMGFQPDPDVVLDTAALLVADNTSLMYEAAALDIPVLALNLPTYRRDVEHGLRFWQYVPGLQCDTPADLIPRADLALTMRRTGRMMRRLATAHAYAAVDGHAADRAATAIIETLNP